MSESITPDFYDRLRNFSLLVNPPPPPDHIHGIPDEIVAMINQLANFTGPTKQRQVLTKFNTPEYKQQLADVVPFLKQTSLMKSLILCLQNPSFRYDALCILCHIASRSADLKRVIVQFEFNGSMAVVQALVSILTATYTLSDSAEASDKRLEQEKLKALECLLIIASNSSTARDYLLENTPTFETVSDILMPSSGGSMTENVDIIRAAMQVVFSLCQGEPKVTLKNIGPVVPLLCNVLQLNNDEEIVLGCCMCLAQVVDIEGAGVLVDERTVKRLIELMSNRNRSVQVAALRVISSKLIPDRNKSTATTVSISAELAAELVAHITTLLQQTPAEAMLPETLLELSRILSKFMSIGQFEYFKLLLDADIVGALLPLLEAEIGDWQRRAQTLSVALQVILMLLNNAKEQQEKAINNGILTPQQLQDQLRQGQTAQLQLIQQQQQQYDTLLRRCREGVVQTALSRLQQTPMIVSDSELSSLLNQLSAHTAPTQQNSGVFLGVNTFHIRIRNNPDSPDDILHLVLRLRSTTI